MIIEETRDLELIKSLLSDPKLFAVTYGQGNTIDTLVIDPNQRYLLIKDRVNIYGFFQLREFTKIMIECHINIVSKYWGESDISLTASIAGFKWLRDNTEYTKAFTDVPICCVEVIRLCKKIGWKLCGIVPTGCVYNKAFTDLLLYEYNLR